MSFPRYPKYKPSGVEWLGEVPEHWGVNPLCALFRRVKRSDQQQEQLLSVYRDLGVVPKASRDDNFNKPSEDLSQYQLVRPGDLVINKMKAWQGSVAISDLRGIVSPAYFTYVSIHKECGRYLHYLMRSLPYIDCYRTISKGIRINQWDLEPEAHRRIPLLLPRISEQRAIAAFLDRQTAKIDALIAEQEKLIELLAEKRQAVISHAVTKGLNPAAPMKPSGVEWLGDVPAHWGVAKCGRFIELLTGFPFPSEQFTTDETATRLLRGVNVGVGRLRWDDTAYWQRSKDDGLARFELEQGDLVLGMDRPWIAEGVRVARVEEDDLPCLLLQRVARMRSRGLLKLDYLQRMLSSPAFVAHFGPETTGVSVPHISPEQICSFVVPVPPLVEQVEIARKIERETATIERLIDEATSAVGLLRERRSALISAAVTGQIDVRNAVPETAA